MSLADRDAEIKRLNGLLDICRWCSDNARK
jgi:hypothetical protein